MRNPTLHQHMLGTTWPNSVYVSEPGFAHLYIRRQPEPFWPRWGQLTISNVEVLKPGNGTLTHALDLWETEWSISFESVLEMRLIHYLIRRGYNPIGSIDSRNFLKEKVNG